MSGRRYVLGQSPVSSGLIAGGAIVLVGTILMVRTDRPPSTAAAPIAQGATSSLVWADEFRGRAGAPPDRVNWGFETGGQWGNGELQYYTRRRANASLDGRGHLAITARQERYTGPDGLTRQYTSARLNTRNRFAFAYGVVEARIRVPPGEGLGPAFWALGNNLGSVGWPAAGEIDVMEVGGSERSVLFGTLHGPRTSRVDYALRAERRMAAPLSDAFHVYGMSWSPGSIVFTVDGHRYGGFRRGDQPGGSRWTFDHPFFLLFTLAVGGEASGPLDTTQSWPATMLVDWVRVWRRSPTFCPTVRARSLRARCPKRPPRAGQPPRRLGVGA